MSRMTIAIVFSLFVTGIALSETVQFKATKGSQTYTVREPVLRIKPGDVLESNTLYSDFFLCLTHLDQIHSVPA